MVKNEQAVSLKSMIRFTSRQKTGWYWYFCSSAISVIKMERCKGWGTRDWQVLALPVRQLIECCIWLQVSHIKIPES